MRVGLDVDELVAQLHYTWITRHNRKHGSTYNLHSLPKWDDYGSPTMMALLTPDIYDDVLPYPGTRAAVDSIRRMGHEVVFITSCGRNTVNFDTAIAKEAWLRRWGYLDEMSGLRSGHMIPMFSPACPGPTKRGAPADVLVDDHLTFVESFHGWSVLQNRVHNLKLLTNKARITHLSDFVEMLWQRRVA